MSSLSSILHLLFQRQLRILVEHDQLSGVSLPPCVLNRAHGLGEWHHSLLSEEYCCLDCRYPRALEQYLGVECALGHPVSRLRRFLQHGLFVCCYDVAQAIDTNDFKMESIFNKHIPEAIRSKFKFQPDH